MRLYHGSNIAIERIDLSRCKPYKDFGKGFYMTDIFSQANEMAMRRVRITGEGSPIVSAFDFDEALLLSDELNVLTFEKPSIEWAQFVLKNRDIRRVGFTHDYDIVVGPVADDTVAFQLRRYLLRIISLEDLVQELTYRHLNCQFFFGTERAISKLRSVCQ